MIYFVFIEHDEKLSIRHQEKIEDLCHKYEKEIDLIKDDLRKMRRERDKFRDKFENLNEDFEEIKRERDRYRQKLGKTNGDFDEYERDHRSSPITRRPHRISTSPEDHRKKDSR